MTDVEQRSSSGRCLTRSLLVGWPPLVEAIASHSSALRAHQAIETVAGDWMRDGEPESRLWDGGQLAAALADLNVQTSPLRRSRIYMLLGADPIAEQQSLQRARGGTVQRPTGEVLSLSESAEQFLRASIRRERRRRARASVILTFLLCLAVLAFGVALNRQLNAERQQRIATARQLLTEADLTRGADSRTALLLNIAAHQISPDYKTNADLVNAVSGSRFLARISGGSSVPTSVAFDVTGQYLGAGNSDGTASIWNLVDPLRPTPSRRA